MKKINVGRDKKKTNIQKEVEPRLYAIGVIKVGTEIVGIRLMVTEGRMGKQIVKDVGKVGVVDRLRKYPNIIRNLELAEGVLRAKDGNLAEYPDVLKKEVHKPYIVLNEIGNVGYTVVDYKGKVTRVGAEELLDTAKTSGLANGRVVIEDGVEVIKPVVGEFEKIEVSKSKLGDTGRLDMRMSMPRVGTTKLENDTKIEVENTVVESDIFKLMTENQKKVIQNFYVWHTVEVYRSLAKTTRLQQKGDKAAKLADLRADIEWQFGGIVDNGFMGGDTCELGHTLRYTYFAEPVTDDMTDEQKKEMYRLSSRMINTGRKRGCSCSTVRDDIPVIKFGETCAGDFFEIAPEDMKKLIKIRKQMSEEINLLADIIANNREEAEWEDVSLLKNVVEILNESGELRGVFGEKLGSMLLAFKEVNLPYPQSLIKLARKEAQKNKGIKDFWKLVFPEKEKEIDEISEKGTSSYGYYGSLKMYMEFMLGNKLDGKYGYDPIKKVCREEGGFNKQTRTERSMLLRRFRYKLGCHDYSIEEMRDTLEVFKVLPEIGFEIRAELDRYRKEIGDVEVDECRRNYMRDLSCIRAVQIGNREYIGYKRELDIAELGLKRSFGDNIERLTVFQVPGKSHWDVIDNIGEIRKEVEYGKTDEFKGVIRKLVDVAIKEGKEQREAEIEKEREIEKVRQREKEEEEEALLREKEKERELEEARRAMKEIVDAEEKSDGDKKIGEATKLIEENEELRESYDGKIIADMGNRGLTWDRMTSKQKYVVERLLAKGKGETLVGEVQNGYVSLDADLRVKELVEKLVNIRETDSEKAREITEVDSIAISIALSVSKKGRYTQKQLKHLEAVKSMV